MLVLFVVIMAFGCGSSKTGNSSTEPQQSTEEEVGFFEEEVYFEKVIETPVCYTKEEIVFDDTYTLKENGNTYIMQLKEKSINEAPISSRTARLQYSETFTDDQSEDEIPKTMTVKYYEDGQRPIEETVILADKEGTVKSPKIEIDPDAPMPVDENGNNYTQVYVYSFELPLASTEPGDQVWISFSAPMNFVDYGAAYYKLSSDTYLPHNDSAPVVEGYEDAILSYLGLSPHSYRIGYAQWDGGTYTNSSGVLCRNAIMYGERLVGTTVATYEDTVPLETVTGYKGRAVYFYRGIVRNTKKVATVAGSSAAVVATGSMIPVVFFHRRRKKDEESDPDVG